MAEVPVLTSVSARTLPGAPLWSGTNRRVVGTGRVLRPVFNCFDKRLAVGVKCELLAVVVGGLHGSCFFRKR